MESVAFDWRSLGKADYSQASALVASLPEEHRAKLVNGVRETLVRIVYLSWKQSEHSGTGAGYCWPSETWLAKAIGKSERTVRRCLVILSKLGLLTWRRRLTKGGAWTSNLYQVGHTFLASLFARGKKKVQQFRDRTKLSDNDLKREYKASAPKTSGALDQEKVIANRTQPAFALEGAKPESAPQVEEKLFTRETWRQKMEQIARERGLKLPN